MPDPKVTTRASKIWTVNLDKLTTTSEYEENVLLCVSPETRELILSLLHFHGYWPNRWRLDDASPLGSVDENTVIETVDKAVREVTLIMGCEGDLKRLADVVVDWYDSTHFDFFEFKALLEASGLDGIVNWIEALEEIGDLLEIVPDINVKMPVGNLVEMVTTTLYRRRQFAKWDDTNAMLQGLIMSDSGPSAPVIIDGIRALIPGNNIVDNILGDLDEQIQTIPAALITALLGNYMTNRTKDIADAVNDLDIDGIVEGIEGIKSECKVCGATGGGCGCSAPAYGEIYPDAAEQGDPEMDDPPAGFSDWGDYFLYKCAASNRMVDDYIATLRATAGMVRAIPQDTLLPVIPQIIGTALTQWSTIGVMRIGFNTGLAAAFVINQFYYLYEPDPGYYDVVVELADALDADKEAVVCELQGVTTTAQISAALLDWQDGHYSGLTYTGVQTQAYFKIRLDNILTNLFNNSVRNLLFQYDQETAAYVGDIDCDDCGITEGDTLSYVEIGGIDCGTGDLTPDDISSRTLTATEFGDGIWRLQFRVDDPDRNVRMQIFDGSVGSVTTWPTSRLRCHPTAANIWITDSENGDGGPVAVAGQTYIGGDFKVNGDGPFSLDVYIYDDFYDSVDCGEV